MLILGRPYSLHKGRDAFAVVRPPHKRSWAAASLIETLIWIFAVTPVVAVVSVFVPVFAWSIVVWVAVSFAVTVWWSLWPFDGHVRAKLARLSKTERRACAAARRRSVEVSAAVSGQHSKARLSLALRRHLALDHSDAPVFVVARTERLVGVYSRLGLTPVRDCYGAMSSETCLVDNNSGTGWPDDG